jgi:hypothetical protein
MIHESFDAAAGRIFSSSARLGEVRKVAVFTVLGKTYSYYVAPVERSDPPGFCTLTTRGSGLEDRGCQAEPNTARLTASTKIDNIGAWVIDGAVPDGTVSLTLGFQDHTTVQVPHGRGWFYVAIGGAHLRPGHRPQWLVARSNDGTVIGRVNVDCGELATSGDSQVCVSG